VGKHPVGAPSPSEAKYRRIPQKLAKISDPFEAVHSLPKVSG
jgi:hypothetical protein